MSAYVPCLVFGFCVFTRPILAQDEEATPVVFDDLVVSVSEPLAASETVTREMVFRRCKEILNAPAGTVGGHPSAAAFPGSVAEDVERTTKTVVIDHEQLDPMMRPMIATLGYSMPFKPVLYSTGLYAAPGEVILAEIPESLVGKLELQIGCHSDNLNQWGGQRQAWRRMPLIVNKTALDATTVQFSNPFGGLVYVLCRPDTKSLSGVVKVSNAVSAPLFVHGRTTPEEWKAMLESSGSPWGEIAGEHIVLTLPTTALTSIDEPVECMKLWDELISVSMDLAQLPLPFYRKQRIVSDVQISIGSMHSGYPLMVTHCPEKGMNSQRFLVTPSEFALPANGGPNWGFFHEVGHNMQNVDWVFNGTTEVSVNLFTLYAFDKIAGGRDDAHAGVSNARTQRVMATYFDGEPDFQKWKSDPFLALTTFRILQSEFGWDLFKRTFRRYHDLSKSERPKNDQEKRDRLVRYLSDSAERNMAPYFQAWGVPLTEQLTEDMKQYSSWMPYGFPPKPPVVATASE